MLDVLDVHLAHDPVIVPHLSRARVGVRVRVRVGVRGRVRVGVRGQGEG